MRCLYADLDGTLLGRGASLMHDGDGVPTMLGVRAIEACVRAGVEIVLMSGRRRAQVSEPARLLGQTLLRVRDRRGPRHRRRVEWLADGMLPDEDGTTIHDQVAAAGAPALLLERFAGLLEEHDPWNTGREVTHVLRGNIDADIADLVLGRARPRAPQARRQRRARRRAGSTLDPDVGAAALLPPAAARGVEGRRRSRAHARARLRAARTSSPSATRARTSARRSTSARSGSSRTRSSEDPTLADVDPRAGERARRRGGQRAGGLRGGRHGAGGAALTAGMTRVAEARGRTAPPGLVLLAGAACPPRERHPAAVPERDWADERPRMRPSTRRARTRRTSPSARCRTRGRSTG